MSRPTIIDVAARSGVSKSTVSNVIRGSAVVSPAARSRVLAAVAELGYRPNAVARQLVQRRTSTVGVFVGDLGNPFYGELAKQLEHYAHAQGFTTMICNTDGRPDREAARVEAMLERRVAGIALLQLSTDCSILDVLIAEGVPAVIVSSTDPRVDSVGVDESRGVSLAVHHLAGLGHRRLCYVTSPYVEERTNRARHASFTRACAALGLDQAAPLVLDVDAVLAGGSADIDDAATGFTAANDLAGLALVEALERRGRSVPRDASVVGFDGIVLTALAGVGLTTVAQPREEMARVGVHLLLERVGGETGPARQVLLEPELVIRKTTGEPRGRSER
ncbi:MAG TPA: LacI family DNA-binding transcriptional regulator [Gaiellaceae bacterium]